MCLLNGTVGGVLPEISYKFDDVEDYVKETDSYKITKIPIKDIVTSIVHKYAGEPMHNIIVNDLDEKGLELLEYRENYPMWMFVGADGDNTDVVINTSISENDIIYINDLMEEEKNNNSKGAIPLSVFDAIAIGTKEDKEKIPAEYKWALKYPLAYSPRVSAIVDDSDIMPTIIRKSAHAGGVRYYLWKIVAGDTVGYRTTDIIYPGDLVEAVGTPVTQVLDKLKNMLGNFEYFYDDDGRFVFQKQRTYIDKSFNNITKDSEGEEYVENAAYTSATEYTFEGNELISSFSNSPNLNNVRNDYSI